MAGVRGDRPSTASPCRTSLADWSPISTTTVSSSEGSSPRVRPETACPVRTVKPRANPRCVSGTPAAAGAAKTELTPGTTSQGIPAASSASTSSPPSTENEGVAPVEADDSLAGSSLTNHPVGARGRRRGGPCRESGRSCARLRARGRHGAGSPTDVDQSRSGQSQVQHFVIDQGIVQDHVGTLDAVQRTQRQKLPATRTGTDDRHRPRLERLLLFLVDFPEAFCRGLRFAAVYESGDRGIGEGTQQAASPTQSLHAHFADPDHDVLRPR